MQPHDPNALLQWGRDHSVAERRATVAKVKPLFMLQWGRDLTVAESAAGQLGALGRNATSMRPRPIRSRKRLHKRVCAGEMTLLQWGRDHSVAESEVVMLPMAVCA